MRRLIVVVETRFWICNTDRDTIEQARVQALDQVQKVEPLTLQHVLHHIPTENLQPYIPELEKKFLKYLKESRRYVEKLTKKAAK